MIVSLLRVKALENLRFITLQKKIHQSGLFIMKTGILGAVIATAIAHGLQFVFHYICAKCINPGEFPFKIVQFIPGLLCVCLTSVLYFFTRDLWIIRWLLGVVLGVYLLLKIFKRKEIF